MLKYLKENIYNEKKTIKNENFNRKVEVLKRS